MSVGGFGTTLLGVVWAECFLAFVLLSARLYAGLRIVRQVREDLYLAILTFVFAVVSIAFMTLSVKSGLGEHIENLTANQITSTVLYSWINQILAIVAIGLGKLAIVAYLVRISSLTKYHPWLLWSLAGSNLIINLVTVGLILAQCSPVQKLWNDALPGTCNGRGLNQHFAYFQGSFSAFCDLILALFPIVLFRKLQVRFRVKLGLCVLMGLGVIAAVCSAVKTAELQVLSKVSDVTYELAHLIVWNETEKWVIIIVGCVPSTRPLFVAIFHTVSSNTRYGSHKTGYASQKVQTFKLRDVPSAGVGPIRKMESHKKSQDNESREEILTGRHGIIATTEFSVTYENDFEGHRSYLVDDV